MQSGPNKTTISLDSRVWCQVRRFGLAWWRTIIIQTTHDCVLRTRGSIKNRASECLMADFHASWSISKGEKNKLEINYKALNIIKTEQQLYDMRAPLGIRRKKKLQLQPALYFSTLSLTLSRYSAQVCFSFFSFLLISFSRAALFLSFRVRRAIQDEFVILADGNSSRSSKSTKN